MTKPVGMMSMAEYKILHQVCPKCGRAPNRLTSVNYPAPPDLNVVECMCNWIGTVNELKPQKKKETTMRSPKKNRPDPTGCPICGHTEFSSTLLGSIGGIDANILTCGNCLWKGIRSDLGYTVAITVDMVIEKYVATRDLITEKKKALDAELADLKALQEKREAWLMSEMTRVGATSLKTPHGTSYIETMDSVSVADWETFFTWVQANAEFEFLTHAVSKTAVKQRLEDGQAPPPGVNFTTFKGIKVRRS